MKRNRLVVSVLLLLSTPAFVLAQPADEGYSEPNEPPPVEEAQPLPQPESGPPPATGGVAAVPLGAPPASATEAPGPASQAPEPTGEEVPSRVTQEHVPGRAIGVGLGYFFPDSEIDVPNAIAVRFRLDERIAFEPLFRVEYTNRKTQDDFLLEEYTASRFDLDAGVNARVGLATAGPAQFLFIGGLGVGFGTTLDVEDPMFDPDSRLVTVAATYGLGVELFFRSRFSLSVDAVNPFVQVAWRKQSYPSGEDVTNRSYSVGAVWAPELRIIVSMYFAQD